MSARNLLLHAGLTLAFSGSLLASTCTNAPSGLVSWWPGEGDVNDSANLNAGALAGGVNFSVGKVGQAFNFSGTNGYLHIPPSANLNVGAGDGFSIEMWINPSDVTRPQPLLQWNDQNAAAPYYGVSLWISVPPTNKGTGPGCLLMDVKNMSATHHPVCSAASLIVSGSWQHVAATYDKTSGVTTLYLNGTLLVQTNIGIVIPATYQDLWLGYERNQFANDIFRSIGSEARFAGGMDEVSIYSRVLQPGEVEAIYSAGVDGKCPLQPTIIAIQPTSLSVAEGGTGNFVALAGGSPPLNFQWKFKGTNLVGATNSFLALTNVQLTDAGNYAVEVANPINSLLSPNAVLTVLPAYAPTWARTEAPSNTWMTVACSADGRKLVAASYEGSIYTSPDFGATWWSNSVPKLAWFSVASSADGVKLMAAAASISGGPIGAIYGSTNSGISWNWYTNGLGANGSYSAIVSSANGANLAAIRYPYIYTSANSGANWTKSGAPFASWRSLACSADGQKLVASTVSYQIHKSSNAGGTWNLTSAPQTNFWQSVASSADGNKLAAAVIYDTSLTSTSGPVFISTNSGVSWNLSGAPVQRWVDIASSADGAKLVGAVDHGYLYVSTSGGMAWQVTRAPNAEWTSVASSADGTKLVAASWGYIYTWEPTALDLSLSGGNVVISWHTNVPGFILQQKADTSATEWSSVTNEPAIVGAKYQVTLLQTPSGQVFRLMYP